MAKSTSGNDTSASAESAGAAAIDGIIDGNEPANIIDSFNAIDPASIEPPKRGRGRPPGSGGKRGSAGNNDGGSSAGPAASSSSGKNNKKTIDLDTLAKQLVGMHLAFAMLAKNEILAISDPEGILLASSIKNVWDKYELPVNPTIIAWAQLGATCAMIYGPKVAFIMMQKKQQQMQQKTQQAAAANSMNGFDPSMAAHSNYPVM